MAKLEQLTRGAAVKGILPDWAEEAGYYNSLVVAWRAISNVPELFQ